MSPLFQPVHIFCRRFDCFCLQLSLRIPQIPDHGTLAHDLLGSKKYLLDVIPEDDILLTDMLNFDGYDFIAAGRSKSLSLFHRSFRWRGCSQRQVGDGTEWCMKGKRARVRVKRESEIVSQGLFFSCLACFAFLVPCLVRHKKNFKGTERRTEWDGRAMLRFGLSDFFLLSVPVPELWLNQGHLVGY